MAFQDNLSNVVSTDELDVSEEQSDIPQKILLVEDNPTIQMVHKVMLIELGCEVDVASSGEEALLYSDNKYDLILLDIGLPGINGVEVARRFRQHEKHFHTRMVAITTNADKKLAKACFAEGIEQVLIKPIEMYELKDIIFECELEQGL